MSALQRALLTSPPALRSEIFRHAVLGQHVMRNSTPLRRSIHTTLLARKYHRLRIPIQHILQKRTQSTTASATSQSHAPPQQPKQHSRTRRILTTTALSLLFFTTGLAMAAAPAADTVNGYINPPSDAETLLLYTPTRDTSYEINEYITNHPLAVRLRSQANVVESRPHMRVPEAMRPHNLTAGTLVGPDKIEVPPLSFNEMGSEDGKLPSMTQLIYLGPALCGHPGVVHGGLLATLLDEGLARAAFPALPHKVGVTASLKIDYRRPCPAGSYVALKAQTTKVEGRKAWCKGWIELLGEEDSEGTVLVEAEALFIEPKNAEKLARNYVASD